MKDNPKQPKGGFNKVYSKIEQAFVRVFRFFSDWIDRILFNERYAKLIAVCLATILSVIVHSGSEDSIFTNSLKSAKDLSGIPVVTNISQSAFEIIDLPEKVDVTITGEASDVQYSAQQSSNYQVLANLQDLGEGTHEIELQPINFPRKVDVSVRPSTVIVTVRKKISRSFSLGYEFINTNSMDRTYSLSPPVLSQNEVIVRASEERMAEIAYVKALIDVTGKKADFEQEVDIVAYNQQGEKIDVDIVPNRVIAKVRVSSPHKEVPIKVEFTGDLPKGMAIDTYTLDHPTLTLYGDQATLDAINEVVVSVPLTGVEAGMTSKSVTVPIMLPHGTFVRGESATLEIEITFSEADSKVVEVPIEFLNWADQMHLDTVQEYQAKVRVTGSKDAIAAFKVSDISVKADMSDIEKSGVFTVQLKVHSNDNTLFVSLEKTAVDIKVRKGD